MNYKHYLLPILSFFIITISANAQEDVVYPTTITTGKYWGTTPEIRDLTPLTQDELNEIAVRESAERRNRDLKSREFPYASTAMPKGPDPVWQSEMGSSRVSRAPILNVAGQTSGSYPPDCNGAVGPNHYMQTVNVTYAIYDKTGNLVSGPFAMNTLFGSVPGANCNNGDPIILYDEVEECWMAAEFSLCGATDRMLIAVSTTNDPTGSWHQYSFDVDDMPDYEKFGIWSDGYYMGTNTPNAGRNDIYVFEKAQMMVGGTAQMVGFDNPWRPTTIDGFHMVPPLDNDGPHAPAGTPGLFITLNDDAIGGGSDQLWIYELDVDWSTPSNSTFTRVQQLNVAAFDSNFGNTWDNINQAGTSQKLDAIPMVIMNRPQYRNFGTYETIVCNHTVDVDGNDHAGIRWYELRRSGGGNWSVRQQGTYAPDGHSRWMGSVALNGSGQIGLGYSISSTSLHPGIRYTGQSTAEYNNASGIMDIPEENVLTGSYSQSYTNRWGDYANISVDPLNDFTFWFSTEYMGSSTHGTQITAFDIAIQSLTAQFSASPTSVCSGGTVLFTDQSLGGPTGWSWSFPGGSPSTSTQQNPSVVYQTPGTYDVTLTVTNATDTDVLTRNGYITVYDIHADFAASPVNVVVGNNVTFTDLSDCSPTSWSWSFQGGTPTSSSSQNPVVTYNSTGTYDVSLTVTNAQGNDTETKSGYITVTNCTYCPSTFSNTTDDWIANVTFNTINNTSGQGGADSYEDFSAISTDVEKGLTYPISVTLEMNGNWEQHVWAFADWNQDCQFDGPGEAFDLGSQVNDGTVTGNITIPANATTGATRLRIVEQYYSDPGPCGPNSSSYGETEDYTVVVIQQGIAGLWTGNSSSDWDTPSNWDNNQVPQAGTPVTIPSTVTSGNWPEKSGNLTLGTDCQALNINGSSLVVITGNLTVPTGYNLEFQSDGLLKIGGDLMMEGNLVPASGTIEFYTTGNSLLDGSGSWSSLSDAYSMTTFEKGMTALSAASSGPSGDDGVMDIPVGFTFNYNGIDYTELRMCTNGWLAFDAGTSSSYTNINLFTSTIPNAALAPWWDDLEDDATSNCYYETSGTAPNRVFTAEWNSVLTYYSAATARVSFQVKLYEADHSIEFHYGDFTAGTHNASEGASIGIEDETGGTDHFIEATTGSSTTAVTNLVSNADWPAVNYRFTKNDAYVSMHDMNIDKQGGTITASTSLEIGGKLEVVSGSVLLISPGVNITVKGTDLLRQSDNGISVIRKGSYD
jgi:PKD repeat protein